MKTRRIQVNVPLEDNGGFTAVNRKWVPHKPSEQMPVDGETWVEVLMLGQTAKGRGRHFCWEENPECPEDTILGWRELS